jgi:pyridoxine kinase
MLLTGYIPNAPSVDAVGAIARDLRAKSPSPGGFFWVLDPVMGDQGRLYVEEAIVGKYRALVGEADLVLPNQFEAELLAGVETGLIGETGEKGAREVIRALHGMGVKHVVITSIRTKGRKGLVVVGSSADSKGQVRGWKIKVPEYRCFFSGTGDMFAGLMVGRLREEVVKLGGKEVLGTKGWVSPDHVRGEETPLARAAEKVLSSMQMVLEKTMLARDREMEKFDQKDDGRGVGESGEGEENMTPETRRYLAETKAAEVRVVKNWRDLVEPEQRYKAEPLDL